jgi:hypothetical protein
MKLHGALRWLSAMTVTALGLVLLVGSGAGDGSGGFEYFVRAASVEPNPIPTPQAGESTSFRIRARARGGSSVRRVTVGAPVTAEAGADYTLVARIPCGSCDGDIVEVACMSELVPDEPGKRLITCSDTPDDPVTPKVLTVGSQVWRFSIQGIAAGMFPFSDSTEATVDLQ